MPSYQGISEWDYDSPGYEFDGDDDSSDCPDLGDAEFYEEEYEYDG